MEMNQPNSIQSDRSTPSHAHHINQKQADDPIRSKCTAALAATHTNTPLALAAFWSYFRLAVVSERASSQAAKQGKPQQPGDGDRMSNIYHLEPPTKGKVVLHTTYGDVDVELWAREVCGSVERRGWEWV